MWLHNTFHLCPVIILSQSNSQAGRICCSTTENTGRGAALLPLTTQERFPVCSPSLTTGMACMSARTPNKKNNPRKAAQMFWTRYKLMVETAGLINYSHCIQSFLDLFKYSSKSTIRQVAEHANFAVVRGMTSKYWISKPRLMLLKMLRKKLFQDFCYVSTM